MNNASFRKKLTVPYRAIATGLVFAGLSPNVFATCDHSIDVSTLPSGEISPSSHSNIAAGDTVCLKGSMVQTLIIRDFSDTSPATKPITFINAPGAQVTIATGGLQVGVSLNNSRNIHLSGANDNGIAGNPYGILVKNTQNKGVKIENQSADIEVDHLEVTNVAFLNKSASGIWAADITAGTAIRGIRIHDNYIHDVGSEGIYIGDSNYYSNRVPAYDIEIYANRVERTGWDGIQIGSARANCTVHHNNVQHDSQADNTSQNSGIILTYGTKCHAYNNLIKDGKGTGILFNAAAGGSAYNNVIINAGLTAAAGSERGIQLNNNTGETADPISVYNNTVVSPDDKGIAFFLDSGTGHLIQNNLVAAPGGTGIYTGRRSNVSVETNYVATTIEAAGFREATNDDYSLTTASPALDTGKLNTLSFDFKNNARPQGLGMDIGAYE